MATANKKSTTVTPAETTAKSTVKITDDMICDVISTCFGGLIYVDQKTGERIVWDSYGESQPISFSMLRSMKASQVGFFRNNWIAIRCVEDCPEVTPADVYKALFVQQYYKNVIDPDDFSVVCGWKESEIEENVKALTPGARQNLAVALNTYIEDGTLDSVRKIKAFEKALGCELSIPE